MKTKKMVLIAMLSALAYIAVLAIRIPVVLFLSYEPKDVVITIGGFLLGPLASAACSAVVSLIEMISFSETGIIGCVMNILSSCSFACTAAFVYKKRHDLFGAVLGLAVGSAVMILIMLLWNYLITPLYMTGTTRADVAAMLIPVFLPFNALKAGFNSALTLLLYKPLVTALRRVGLVESRATGKQGLKLGIYLFAGVLLITCILFLLVISGVI